MQEIIYTTTSYGVHFQTTSSIPVFNTWTHFHSLPLVAIMIFLILTDVFLAHVITKKKNKTMDRYTYIQGTYPCHMLNFWAHEQHVAGISKWPFITGFNTWTTMPFSRWFFLFHQNPESMSLYDIEYITKHNTAHFTFRLFFLWPRRAS